MTSEILFLFQHNVRREWERDREIEIDDNINSLQLRTKNHRTILHSGMLCFNILELMVYAMIDPGTSAKLTPYKKERFKNSFLPMAVKLYSLTQHR